MSAPNINDLRQQLLATLQDLRSREAPMEPDRARAIAQVAAVVVDSARVEVEFLRATNGAESAFMSPPAGSSPALPPASPPPLGPGIVAVRQHRLRG